LGIGGSGLANAVILLSGGLDSYTAGAIARAEGFDLFALSLVYGQRHVVELEAARRVASALRVKRHIELFLDLSAFGGSSLVGEGEVPKDRVIDAPDIPSTYVPARNTVFLSLALAWAEALGAEDLFVGVNAVDYSGYPDCRPEFLRAFERLSRVATKAGVEGRPVRIRAPLLRLTKARIVRLGTRLGVPYRLTLSCYDPVRGRACGRCDACQLRRKGFLEAGIPDPTRYATPASKE